MLRIVTGPFHPNLEQALVADLHRLKRHDPLAPVAIIVPSSRLLARLQELVVLESALPVLNVHFLTFHQLAVRLLNERGMVISTEDSRLLSVVSDLFFEQLLRRIARSDLPGLEALRMVDLGPGAWTALWATVRDLKDAAIDAKTALIAVAEGQFGGDHTPRLLALFMLYASVLEASETLGVGTAEDPAALSASWALRSPFLCSLQAVYYYGFYDLTELQLSLFRAVTQAAPVTLFFPLLDQPDYRFARRFFERYLLTIVGGAPHVRASVAAGGTPMHHAHREALAGDPPAVEVLSTVGPEDELTLVCKEILMLVETHGYRFSEIGVVSRTLQPYAPSLGRIFDEHRIPFLTTATTAAVRHPAVKVWLQLARLPVTGLSRRAVLDIVTAPLYRHTPKPPVDVPQPRPDLWHLAVNLLGIRGGEEDWSRLATVKSSGLARDPHLKGQAETRAASDAEELAIPAAQLCLFSDLVSRLIKDVRALPGHGTVVELTDAFEHLVSDHLEVDRDESLAGLFDESLRQLRALDAVTEILNWEEWFDLLTRVMDRATLPIEPGLLRMAGVRHGGVQVLDAMAARGLPFRALFLIGLNEKVFPRFIQEDAFLRDPDRRTLDATLGYKIDEKLTGYDEELLLFTLLCSAGRQRLYLLYQRADLEGRPLAPSPYLSMMGPPAHVPRRFADRIRCRQFAEPFLTPDERIVQLVLGGSHPSALFDVVNRDVMLFDGGIEALGSLEGSETPSAHDGFVGTLEGHWSRLATRGVAPTALEDYARCPTRYFLKHVLKVQSFRQAPADLLPPQALGSLIHTILRRCSERLVAMGWPATPIDPAVLRLEAGVAAEEAFAEYAAEHGRGYALLWDIARETLTALTVATLEEDERDYRDSGFRPVAFEVDAEGGLEDLPAGCGAMKVRGRLDRLDQRMVPFGFRVVDYKFKPGRQMDGADRDLTTAALRGVRLQPPLYALMNLRRGEEQRSFGGGPEQVQFRYLAPRWEPPVSRATFEASLWRGEVGERLRGTVGSLLEGIHAGRFVMLPGDYCDHCDVATACRRLHRPSWWRAQSSSFAKAIRLLRRLRIEHGDEPSAAGER